MAPMHPVSDVPFTDQDLDRLEELLDSEIFKGESMQLDELQAVLCAVISGPLPTPPGVWLPAVLGEGVQHESDPIFRATVELILRFHNDLAHKLAAGDDWELILYPVADDPDDLDFATWTDAYIFGSQLGSDWFEEVGDHVEELTELLQPLFLLNGMLKEDARLNGERWMSPAQERSALAAAREELPDLISEIHDFWRAKRDSDAAIEREVSKKQESSPAEGFGSLGDLSKPGRNDPCPCGSGKKYKQCCGSPEKLH